MSLTRPPECPKCGYDPTGDTTEFRSGGGWGHDHSLTSDARGNVWVERLYCPVCGETVERDEQQLYDERRKP